MQKPKINTESIAQKTLEAIYATKSIERLNEFCRIFYREDKYVMEAKRIRDRLAFEQTQKEGTIEAYQDFITQYPDAMQTALVQSFIDQQLLHRYSEMKNTDSLLAFSASVSDNALAEKALTEAEKITFERALLINKAESYAAYLAKYPDGIYSLIAKNKYDKAILSENLHEYKVSTLINFLEKYPDHPSYQQLLDTLQYIANSRCSDKGLQFCNSHSKQQSIDSIIRNCEKKQARLIPIPRKAVKIYNEEILTAYIPDSTDTIDVSELRSAFSDTDFFFFNNANAIVFASNREDGYGTDDIKTTKEDSLKAPFDLYVSFRRDGQWSQALLLPHPLNNTANQRIPVLSACKTMLFFSSQYGKTYGNDDIYLSYRSDTNDWLNWSEPLHLSYGFNTKGNDYVTAYNGNSIIIKQESAQGNAQFKRLSTKNSEPMFRFRSGHVQDIDGKPLSATLTLTDQTTNKETCSTKSNIGSGFFAFLQPEKPYYIIATKEGCIPSLIQSSQISSESISLKFQLNNIKTLTERKRIHQIESLPENTDVKTLPSVMNIYFDYLAKELLNIEDMVSVSVFCSRATKDLSPEDFAQIQANLIKTTLIRSGIASERIVAVGFESKTDAKCRIEIGFITN